MIFKELLMARSVLQHANVLYLPTLWFYSFKAGRLALQFSLLFSPTPAFSQIGLFVTLNTLRRNKCYGENALLWIWLQANSSACWMSHWVSFSKYLHQFLSEANPKLIFHVCCLCKKKFCFLLALIPNAFWDFFLILLKLTWLSPPLLSASLLCCIMIYHSKYS